jgi:GT2 family glycosyltransferase
MPASPESTSTTGLAVSTRVHAVVVARPDGRVPAAHHLKTTLAAVRAGSRRPDRLTVVLCGTDAGLSAAATESTAGTTSPGADLPVEVVVVARSASYADALRLTADRLVGDAVWLLAQDTTPDPDALARLVAALDLAPSVAFAAPKLVDADDHSAIVSLGVTMTRLGAAVGLADGQLDQQQHDGDDDVLGSDIRGILVRADAWRTLRGIDRGLAGADEGLDLGVRARLAGGRVSVVPTAIVAVAGDGVAGMPAAVDAARTRHRTRAARRAQLQRRLAYGAAIAVPFLWLAILPLALWRTIVQLIAKTPALILPEWGAALVAFVRWDAVVRARRTIRSSKRASWGQLAPLRITRAQRRQLLEEQADDDGPAGVSRPELHFFTGGGAWIVLAALVASVAAFPALLAWPVLAGGALAPLHATVAQLWADAAYGRPALGLDAAIPADPFSAVIAVLGSVWPSSPSRAIVLLWLGALPLAALGGWFAATRLTDRASLRNLAAVGWALAPTLLAALVLPRPAAVIAHLLLPWLFYAGSVAHRSWSAAGATSLLLLAVVACAPSLAPALGLLWLVALVFAVAARRRRVGTPRGRRVAQLIWVVIPTLVFAAPLVVCQVRTGTAWGLLADPGVVWAGPQAGATGHGRTMIAMGFPTADPGGWESFVHGVAAGLVSWASWAPILLVPLAVLAILAPVSRRWAAGILLVLVAVLGIGTALAAVGVAVSSTDGAAVPLWPGTGLSLAWAGVLGAALVTLDAGFFRTGHGLRATRRVARLRGTAVALVLVPLAVLAVPALTAHTRGDSDLVEGAPSTLPAYVAAVGRNNPDTGTLVLAPLPDGTLSATVVWGDSETLGGQSTVQATRTGHSSTPTAVAGAPVSVDGRVAAVSAALVTTASDAGGRDAVQQAAALGIGYVLLAPSDSGSDAQDALHLGAATVLDQRKGLESVGATSGGTLWRITARVTARPGPDERIRLIAGWIAVAELAVVGIAVLLAVPTPSSVRRARRSSRVVGVAPIGGAS